MSSIHGAPSEGMTCQCCWEDIDTDLYVEYKASADTGWLPSGFCIHCIKHLLSTQWDTYVNTLCKTTCKAEQRRMLTRGPPINLSDKTALPCPDDEEVYALWYMSSPDEEQSAKLTGSLVGKEREEYWNSQRQFYISDEPDEETA